MSLSKSRSGKNYILSALGEITLIVVGILLALYINNKNANQQNQNQIDTNVFRVYDDLENNIEQARKTINNLSKKDSLINLVMNDSLTEDNYYANLDVAYLVIQNVQLSFEEKAINNLNQINVSGNKYKEELLSEIREIHSLMKKVNAQQKNMANFIYETSMPLLVENIKTFGDLTYKREVKEDALDFFLNSKEYKSLVAQYAIYAVRLQLDSNRRFYKKALDVYSLISAEYDLVNNRKIEFSKNTIATQQGVFIREDYPDTLEVKYDEGSFLIGRKKDGFVNLVPLNENHYFLDGKGQERYFVSFQTDEQSKVLMKLQLFSDRFVFKKN